jgi:uncharacterized repeat protein (TIGR01451 family)
MATGVPQTASAALQGDAGNSIIRNVVKVTYSDVVGVAQTPVYSSIDVTVNTVNVAPTVLSFSPLTGSTSATGDTEAYTVTIRTNSNGPGSIALSGSDGSATNITLSGTSPSFLPNSLYLGSTIIDPTDTNIGVATTITASGGTVSFKVPNDGAAYNDAGGAGAYGDGVINGLTTGDIVYLYDGTNYYPFTVGTVTDPAAGSFASATETGKTAVAATIQLINNTGGDITVTPDAGWMIVEAKTTTMTVTQGTVTDPTLPASWVTTVTASMGGVNGTGTVTTNAAAGALTVSKFVRNNTVPVAGATLKSYGGNSYYATGVNGKPTDTLEYLIFIKNTGTATATNIVVSDHIPEYTTYQAASVAMGIDSNFDGAIDISYTMGGAGDTDADSEGAGKIVWLDSGGTQPVLNVYAGQDAPGTAVGGNDTTKTGGELPAGGEIFVTFRVTID